MTRGAGGEDRRRSPADRPGSSCGPLRGCLELLHRIGEGPEVAIQLDVLRDARHCPRAGAAAVAAAAVDAAPDQVLLHGVERAPEVVADVGRAAREQDL